ncbi:hypothetical protein ACRAWD_20340 [Caulobacter segnis]
MFLRNFAPRRRPRARCNGWSAATIRVRRSTRPSIRLLPVAAVRHPHDL